MSKIELEKIVGAGRIREDFVLAPYTTFKMGGPAEFFYEAHEEEDLIIGVKAAHTLGMPVRVLGGASNIVIRDEGIRGLVIRNLTSQRKTVSEDEKTVTQHISSGYSMTRLAKETAQEGLEGLEYHLGLPGTIGGAMFMNSKWVQPNDTTYYAGDAVIKAQLVALDGSTQIVTRDYFNFAYDYSKIQETHEMVVWLEMKFKKQDPEVLIEKGKKALEYRKQTQPFGVATSGCFFKNVNGQSAGKMIDDLGLKGYSVGNATVSDIHANFILNKGGATTDDVEKLIQEIKNRVHETYNVALEQEVSVI